MAPDIVKLGEGSILIDEDSFDLAEMACSEKLSGIVGRAGVDNLRLFALGCKVDE